MRIIAGKWAGRSLASPGGRVRPTPEGLRDAWMDRLADDLRDARVLDLYAGTGALGLEALSRGAKSVDFVERGGEALHSLKANRAKLRASRKSRLFKKDVFLFLDGIKGAEYDLVLADPPLYFQSCDKSSRALDQQPFFPRSLDRTSQGTDASGKMHADGVGRHFSHDLPIRNIETAPR